MTGLTIIDDTGVRNYDVIAKNAGKCIGDKYEGGIGRS